MCLNNSNVWPDGGNNITARRFVFNCVLHSKSKNEGRIGGMVKRTPSILYYIPVYIVVVGGGGREYMPPEREYSGGGLMYGAVESSRNKFRVDSQQFLYIIHGVYLSSYFFFFFALNKDEKQEKKRKLLSLLSFSSSFLDPFSFAFVVLFFYSFCSRVRKEFLSQIEFNQIFQRPKRQKTIPF